MTYFTLKKLSTPKIRDWALEAVEREGHPPGMCICCGTEVANVAPDAAGHACPSCMEWALFGLDELLTYTSY